MWTDALGYLVNSLAWSILGLLIGAALAELGWDIGSIIRNSGRRKDDHT